MHGFESFFLAGDIGRRRDYSAIALLGRRWELPPAAAINWDNAISRLYVLMLMRFPLETDYKVIEDRLADIWAYPELKPTSNYMILDMTGVGDPIVLDMRRKRVHTQGIIITSGNNATHPEEDEWHVPKSVLATNLMNLVQTGKLKVLNEVADAKEFASQLEGFKYKINRDTGNVTYEAETEKIHDDLVIAVALAAWYAVAVVPKRDAIPRRADIAPKYDPFARRAK